MKMKLKYLLALFIFFIFSFPYAFAAVNCELYKAEGTCNGTVGCSWNTNKNSCVNNNCTTRIGITNIGIDLLSDPTGRTCPNLGDGSSSDGLADSLGKKVSVIVKVILGFSATIGLVAFVYAGVMILTSKGDPKSFQSGVNVVKYTFIGIIIIIFSYAIVNFLTSTIPSVTGGTGGVSVVTCSTQTACSSVADTYCCLKTSGFTDCVDKTCTLIKPGDSCGKLGGKCYKTNDTANTLNKIPTGDGFCSSINGWDCYKNK